MFTLRPGTKKSGWPIRHALSRKNRHSNHILGWKWRRLTEIIDYAIFRRRKRWKFVAAQHLAWRCFYRSCSFFWKYGFVANEIHQYCHETQNIKDGTVRHYLFDTKTNTRLFEFDSHGFNTKSGRTKPLPHINVKSKPNANVFQTKLANALDHKKIPQSVYDAFKNFDDVGKSSKKVVKQLRLSVLSWTLSTSEQPSMTTIRTTDILARKPYHRQHESAEAGLVPGPAQKAEQHWGRWSAVCFREQAM